jgi:hypothetical protein
VETSTTEFWDSDTNEYFLWSRSSYTYESGRVRVQTFESTDFFTGTFGPSLRYTFDYDGSGNTTQRLHETYDDTAGDWVNWGLKQWSYDGNGQETEDLEQNWDPITSTWVNDYREVTTFTPDSSDPTEIVMSAQEWDPLANGAQGDWVNRDRGILNFVSATSWIQTEQDWDSAASDWVNRSEESITLDANGDYIEFVSRTWDTGLGDWVNEDRSSFIEDIARFPTEFRLLVESLSESQLDTPYREGGWTVRQVVHHVPDSHLQGYERFKLATTESVPTIKTYHQAAWGDFEDAKSAPVSLSLDLLDALHRRWVFFLRSLSEEGFAKTYRHPDLGELSLDTTVQLYAWHGKHHFGHVKLVAEKG